MKQYRALRKTLLAHESRVINEGEVFETEFPLVNGQPMKLGDNIVEVADDKPAAKAKGRKGEGDDLA